MVLDLSPLLRLLDHSILHMPTLAKKILSRSSPFKLSREIPTLD